MLAMFCRRKNPPGGGLLINTRQSKLDDRHTKETMALVSEIIAKTFVTAPSKRNITVNQQNYMIIMQISYMLS